MMKFLIVFTIAYVVLIPGLNAGLLDGMRGSGSSGRNDHIQPSGNVGYTAGYGSGSGYGYGATSGAGSGYNTNQAGYASRQTGGYGGHGYGSGNAPAYPSQPARATGPVIPGYGRNQQGSGVYGSSGYGSGGYGASGYGSGGYGASGYGSGGYGASGYGSGGYGTGGSVKDPARTTTGYGDTHFRSYTAQEVERERAVYQQPYRNGNPVAYGQHQGYYGTYQQGYPQPAPSGYTGSGYTGSGTQQYVDPNSQYGLGGSRSYSTTHGDTACKDKVRHGFDNDKDGFLSLQEANSFFRAVGLRYTDHETYEKINKISPLGGGYIRFGDLCKWIANNPAVSWWLGQ